MQSLLERSGALSAALLLLAAVSVWLGGVAGDASADPPIRTLAESRADGARLTLPARFASHHDDEEDDDGDHDHDDWDEDEEDFERLEVERLYVEMERAGIEAIYGGMELVEKVAEIASDDDKIAALAINSVRDVFEPEEAEALLLEAVERSPSIAARRVARLQLAELYGEQDDLKGVRKQLRALIFGED